jgi:hypothetical protein
MATGHAEKNLVSCILCLLMIYSTHSGFGSSSKFHLYARLCIYIYTYSICIYVYIHIWGLFKIMVPQNCYTHPYLQMFIYDPSYLICVVKHCQIPQLPITGIRMPKILSSAHASRPFWADGFDLATLVALKG